MMPVSLRAVRVAEFGIAVGVTVIALAWFGFIAAGSPTFWALAGVALLIEAAAYYMHDQYRWASTEALENQQ